MHALLFVESCMFSLRNIVILT